MMGSPYSSNTFGKPLSLRVDSAVSAMSLSPNGRDVVLAGREGLMVIDMDDPFLAPRIIQHATAWEVADVQWSPHAAKPLWVVSTSNQKAMVWNLARSSSRALEHVLHRHVRAITDINFHPTEPEMLATCSVDSFTFAWDMRAPRKPCQLFPDWRTAATQVKWSHTNPHILASLHDNYFHIWDTRHGALPLSTTHAHAGKINGLEFSPTANQLLTCSNDQTVKLWDYTSSASPTTTIRAPFPVSRARFLPFSDAACAIMPLTGDCAMYLAALPATGESEMEPCYAFRGHSQPVRDFLWRERYHEYPAVDDREFQLVTWAKDGDLRLWQTTPEMYTPVPTSPSTHPDKSRHPDTSIHPDTSRYLDGYAEGYASAYPYDTYSAEPAANGARHLKHLFVSRGSTAKFSHLDWIAGVRLGSDPPAARLDHQPANLGEEVSIVGHRFPRVRFETIAVSTGTLVVSLNGTWGESDEGLLFIRMTVTVLAAYPRVAPAFAIEESHELGPVLRAEMEQALAHLALLFAARGRFCLEACLRCLMGETVSVGDLAETEYDYAASLSSLSDGDDEELVPLVSITARGAPAVPAPSPSRFDSTPVPKGCGAVWTRDGGLLCFFGAKGKPPVLRFDTQGFGVAQPDAALSDASSDSFDDDWNEILARDVPTRMRMPAYTNLGLRHLRAQRRGSAPTDRSHGTTAGRNTVRIFDYSHLLPDKIELAREYRIVGLAPDALARHNAAVASAHNYPDLADCWNVVAVMLTREVAPTAAAAPAVAFLKERPAPSATSQFFWGNHPYGRAWLVRELFRYYEYLGNVQMLAMLSCVLYEHPQTPLGPPAPPDAGLVEPLPQRPTTVVSRVATSTPVSTTQDRSRAGSVLSQTSSRHRRLDSVSGSSYTGSIRSSSPDRHSRSRRHIAADHSRPPLFGGVPMTRTPSELQARRGPLFGPKALSHTVHIEMCNEHTLDLHDDSYMGNLLDPLLGSRYRAYREEYAELLYLWGLPASRAQVLKFNHTTATTSLDMTHRCAIEFDSAPPDCHYCGLRIRKSLFVCNACDHVMHAACATEWWNHEVECASGCGCPCPSRGDNRFPDD